MVTPTCHRDAPCRRLKQIILFSCSRGNVSDTLQIARHNRQILPVDSGAGRLELGMERLVSKNARFAVSKGAFSHLPFTEFQELFGRPYFPGCSMPLPDSRRFPTFVSTTWTDSFRQVKRNFPRRGSSRSLVEPASSKSLYLRLAR